PITAERVRSRPEGDVVVVVRPESLAGCHGALTVSLAALVGGERRAGIPCWVIQESSLTRQGAGEGRDSLRRQIEETGQGLTRLLAELRREAKIDDVIDYLRRLPIKFDGGGSHQAARSSRRSSPAPFRPDAPADWLAGIPGVRREDLWTAILKFADRH